jgi:hypothetical protein
MHKLLFSLGILSFTAAASAADDHLVVTGSNDIHWVASKLYPNGTVFSLLTGDPTQSGLYSSRFRIPANTRVGPHSHRTVTTGVVITGRYWIGEGEKFDPSNGKEMQAGAFWAVPARRVYYTWTGPEEAVIEVTSTGPATFDYVDPADDPRR